MKGICVFKGLLFVNILCLLWLPNFCDIKHNGADNQEKQASIKIESSGASGIENVPSQQEKETGQQDPYVDLKDTMPNVKYVNNLEIKEMLENSKNDVESLESDLSHKTIQETITNLESSRTSDVSIKEESHKSKTTETLTFKISDIPESKATKLKTDPVPPVVKSSTIPETIVHTHKASEKEVKTAKDTPWKSAVVKENVASPVPVRPVKSTAEDSVHHQPHYDGMPSFDEWKKMMLAEQERGGQKMPSPIPPGKKISSQKRRRNYSSFECGAKIVASNPEAEGTSRILNEMVDEYMLNPCKAKIWFVIELCETVQATQIELANFELFSSCPKDFAVYSSDNFPTRDWVPLGSFTAAEQRVLQSFELKQEGFGKFIKIELLSYYGTEHYCPLSVVRIFGTSMVDEYEEMETLSSHNHIHEDDLDRLDIVTEDKKATNIFGTATDAVINIVKKAAQALGQHQNLEDSKNNETTQEKQNASGVKLSSVLNQSENKCENATLEPDHIIQTSLVNFPIPSSSMHHSLFRLLHRCDQCVSSRIRYYSSAQPHCRFFQAALGPVIFQTLCDWFKEHPVIESSPHANKFPLPTLDSTILPTKSPPPQVMRVAVENDIPWKKLISNDTVPLGPIGATVMLNSTDFPVDKRGNASLSEETKLQPSLPPTGSHQIVITAVFNASENAEITSEISDESITPSETASEESLSKVPDIVSTKVASPDVVTSEFVPLPSDYDTSTIPDVLTDSEVEQMSDFMSDTILTTEETSGTVTVTEFPVDVKAVEDKSFDEKVEYHGKIEPVSVSGIGTAGQKESVFMRMSNRIKALEINMSLSSQYLQELSQRYRRQMEEMQRAFNRTIGTLNDTAKKAAEKDLKQQEVLNSLQLQVSNLTEHVNMLLKERSSKTKDMLEFHLALMIIQVIVMVTIMSICARRMSSSAGQMRSPPAKETVPMTPRLSKRRSSVDSCTPPVARKVKKRSASEEALSAEKIMVVEPLTVVVDSILKGKKKNRKRNKAIQRSNSNPSVPPRNPTSHFPVKRVSNSDSSMQANLKSKLMPHGLNSTCENCNYDRCVAVKAPDKERRPNGAPLQNLTNGSIIKQPFDSPAPGDKFKGRERFSFKKLLKFQKRDSI